LAALEDQNEKEDKVSTDFCNPIAICSLQQQAKKNN